VGRGCFGKALSWIGCGFEPFSVPPTTEPNDDLTVERDANLYGPLSPRARATSLVASACDPTAMVVTHMLKSTPELHRMCEGPISSPSLEHLMVDSLVPSTMAPLDSSLVTTLEESDAPANCCYAIR
jgi:hypothetical protein